MVREQGGVCGLSAVGWWGGGVVAECAMVAPLRVHACVMGPVNVRHHTMAAVHETAHGLLMLLHMR